MYNDNDIEKMLKNSLCLDRNDRNTLEEVLNYPFIKKIWNHNG